MPCCATRRRWSGEFALAAQGLSHWLAQNEPRIAEAARGQPVEDRGPGSSGPPWRPWSTPGAVAAH
ncbi:protein of unknown function (plasmid) [Azospirillum baldaniorum]|uniref:Uncharacterized protein n=1 Tax=Azospirillum baldaniorum TaxID=1064539 RepID=A0A9P1NQM5_9PROT|nr:protein of unknown function [Azospirillum baldaniorum]